MSVDFSEIKLIIWDLDDTIWRGTLSEDGVDGVVLDNRIQNLFKRLTDCGVINSVCSKNTKEDTIPVLERLGLSEYIVFPSIDWTPKGVRIKDLITTMSLRPMNVLFIDDNIQNLNEAQFYSEGLLIAEPSIIGGLKEYFDAVTPKDMAHKRLKQYRVLEDKHEAASKYDSNEEFLYSSNIRVDIHTDCLEQLNRLYELSQRTNQLNFTKNRESLEEFKHSIETADDTGYVTVKDNFGDYGIVGFYVVKDKRLKHFLFSCRTIGQGIEQYVYATLNYPTLTIVGEVYNAVSKDAAFPRWINQKGVESSSDDNSSISLKVLFKGPCDLSSTVGYINSSNIDCEFTYMSQNGMSVESHLHHVGILSLLDQNECQGIISNVPFVDEKTYESDFWTGNYGLIVLSTLPEGNLGIYKSDWGRVAFGEYLNPLTDEKLHDKFVNHELFTSDNNFSIDFLKLFAKEWKYCGRTEVKEYIDFLDVFFNHEKTKGAHLALILGSEIPYLKNTQESYEKRELFHKEFNAAIKEYAFKEKRLHLIEITQFITSQSCFTNNINHYTSEVYYNIAQSIIQIAEQLSGVSIKGKNRGLLYLDKAKIYLRNFISSDTYVYKLLQRLYQRIKYGKSYL